jgi:predicted DNA-binding transcriptional regulator YafY
MGGGSGRIPEAVRDPLEHGMALADPSQGQTAGAVAFATADAAVNMPDMTRPKPPSPQFLQRAQIILQLLRSEPLPANVLCERLNQELASQGEEGIGVRMLNHDLAGLQRYLGTAMVERVSRSQAGVPAARHPSHRVFYRLINGGGLIPVSNRILAVTELEAIALRTARGVLSRSRARSGKRDEPGGPLADALDHLMERLGLDTVDQTDLDIVSLGQTVQQDFDAGVFASVFSAIRSRSGLSIRYDSLRKAVRTIRINPIRILLSYDEPHLWAWDGDELKNYKIARIRAAEPAKRLPGQPQDLDLEAQRRSMQAFDGYERGPLVTVDLYLAPGAVRQVEGRTFGLGQRSEPQPDGGLRISFRTGGFEALKPWILSLGGQLRVHAPAALRTWVKAEAQRILAASET